MIAAAVDNPTTVGIRTPGLHHVALRSSDLARSRVFYVDRLGFPVMVEADGVLIFGAGGTAIALLGPSAGMPSGDSFNPHRVGLDHVALTCTDSAELRRVADALSAAGIRNTGVKTDTLLKKDYVAFKDPDGISWEFYMA